MAMSDSKRKRIALVTASPMTIKAFMSHHVKAWAERCNVTLFANFRDALELGESRIPATPTPIAIQRKISPWRDLLVLLLLCRHFRLGRFDTVISLTPKAGLLAMLAGWITRVPIRIHIFTGQVWATRSGASRIFLRWFDWLIAHLATEVLADSESQRQFLISERVVTDERSLVIGHGSVCGVDARRFRPDSLARATIRAGLNVSEQDVLILFMGRLTHDKGVLDLGAAFAGLSKNCLGVHLLLVGPDEESIQDLLEYRLASAAARLHFVRYTDNPESYMAAADILCLPSYREGFGTVVIEAAAVGVPAVVSRIYGLTDAVVDGETGFLFPPRNCEELQSRLELLIRQPSIREKLGVSARDRALKSFAASDVSTAFASHIFRRLDMDAGVSQRAI
jgi:glycosyltransferase involved in cell wall biosynthesis